MLGGALPLVPVRRRLAEDGFLRVREGLPHPVLVRELLVALGQGVVACLPGYGGLSLAAAWAWTRDKLLDARPDLPWGVSITSATFLPARSSA